MKKLCQLLILGSVVLGATACTQSEEERLISAVREFYIANGIKLEHALKAKLPKGNDLVWQYRKINDAEYQLSAVVGEPKQKDRQTFNWIVTKNIEKSSKKAGSVWVLKADNKPAKDLIRTSQMASFASLPARQ